MTKKATQSSDIEGDLLAHQILLQKPHSEGVPLADLDRFVGGD